MTIIHKYQIFCMKRKSHQCMYSFSIGFGGVNHFWETSHKFPDAIHSGLPHVGKGQCPPSFERVGEGSVWRKGGNFLESFGAFTNSIYLGLSPCPVTVTTRIVEGDPYKPSFATVTGRGDNPKYLLFGLGRGISFQLYNFLVSMFPCSMLVLLEYTVSCGYSSCTFKSV